MEDTLYTKSGAAIGFHDGKKLYDLRGQAVGQLRGSRVYCMGGHYVGVLKNGVILDRNLRHGSMPAYNRAGGGARGKARMQNQGPQPVRRTPK
jgi:hypothetical protein